MRAEKGITLVALIITIVVLMILAGVAISSIQDNGILGYAENAATAWNEAQKNESETLDGYLGYLNPCLEGHTYGTWITVSEADCSTLTDGLKERVCTVCGVKEREVVLYLHSNYGDDDCGVCGQRCSHTEWEVSSYGQDSGDQHIKMLNCKHCALGDHMYENCEWENEKCKYCGKAKE